MCNKKYLAAWLIGVNSVMVCAQSQETSSLLDGLSQEAKDGGSISLFADARYTDNVAKKDTDKQTDLIQTYGVDLSYLKNTRAVNAKANYRLKNTGYRDSSFSDEVWLSGASQLIISTTPERYSWFARHQQSARQVNFLQADTPDNRDERSTFITGPDVNLQISPVDTLSLQARSISTRFDKSTDNDSDRNTGSIRLSHSLNSQHKIALVGSYSDVDFELAQNDYRNKTIGIELSGVYRSSFYQLSAGNSSLERRNGLETDDGYLRALLSLNQDNGQWLLSYSREITDSSIGLSLNTLGGANPFNNTQGDTGEDLDGDLDLDGGAGDGDFRISDVIYRTRMQASYTRKVPNSRVGMSLRVLQNENDYEQLLADTRSLSGVMNLHYDMAENLRWFLNFEYRRTDFIDTPGIGEDEIEKTKLGAHYDVGEALRLSFDISYEARDNQYISSREYDAFGTAIHLNYRWR